MEMSNDDDMSLSDLITKYQLDEGIGEVADILVAILKENNPDIDASSLYEAIAIELLNRNQNKRQNFIAKHWRGDYSLSFSWWVIGISVNVINKIFDVVDNEYFKKINLKTAQEVEQILYYVGPLISYLFAIFVFVWHSVGTWRSATKYSLAPENKNSYWGTVAKVIICLWVAASYGAMIKG